MNVRRDKRLQEEDKKTEEYLRKVYVKPFLINYGCVERLTQGGGSRGADTLQTKWNKA
jgi:hypothetical protein